MKSLLLTLLLTVLVGPSLFSQCQYNSVLQTKAELDAMNCYLARRFAPVLFQYANTDPDDDPESNFRDTPTRVDYDGDWNHLNNWDHHHLVNYREPWAYYHVTWTAELYIITYSYYYPRDWSSTGNIFCNKHKSQHEGDVERAIVYVSRASTKIRAWSVSNHGQLQTFKPTAFQCLDEKLFPETPPNSESIYYPGQHPMIYSSTGSHGIYINSNDAYEDEGTGQKACRPEPEFVVGMAASSTGYFDTDFHEPFDGMDWNLDGNLPFHSTTYRLIDVFDESAGLDGQSFWDQRNNNNENTGFFPDAICEAGGMYPIGFPCWAGVGYKENNFSNYSEQRLYCDNHCGCIFACEQPVAAAPWNGQAGIHILSWLKENLNSFPCCIGDIVTGQCQTLNLSSTKYTYNEYLCPSYSISANNFVYDKDNGVTQVTFRFASMGYLFSGPVNWSVGTTSNAEWECVSGCDQMSNTVIIEFEGHYNPFDSDFILKAVGNSLDCGQVIDKWSLPVSTLIADDTEEHVDQDESDMAFRQVENNDVLQHPTATLSAFPNPAKQFINLKLEVGHEPGEICESHPAANPFIGNKYFILDTQQRLVLMDILTSSEQQIDISRLGAGMYSIFLQAKDGSIVNAQFSVIK